MKIIINYQSIEAPTDQLKFEEAKKGTTWLCEQFNLAREKKEMTKQLRKCSRISDLSAQQKKS